MNIVDWAFGWRLTIGLQPHAILGRDTVNQRGQMYVQLAGVVRHGNLVPGTGHFEVQALGWEGS